MIVDGVKIDDLIRMMNRPIKINETDYWAWREEKTKQRKGHRDWIRGADFYGYWKCSRMLWLDTHNPLPSRPYFSKAIYSCVVRHDMIEAFLTKHAWECEALKKKWFNIVSRRVKGLAHIDALSPSKIVLDIKMGQPSKGHRLQTGYYQLHELMSPAVILLYRGGIEYHKNLRPLANRYLSRVVGCVLSDITPPLHPSFPYCFRQCVYIKWCGRKRVPNPIDKSEWSHWFKQIDKFLRFRP